MIQQFRDIHGYLIPQRLKPRYFEHEVNTGILVAKFVYCPERDGLIAIGNCKTCKNYDGIERYQGVRCKTTCTRKAPNYYDKIPPKYKFKYEDDD